MRKKLVYHTNIDYYGFVGNILGFFYIKNLNILISDNRKIKIKKTWECLLNK